MSLKTTSYVLQRRFGNQTRKLLMIAIADYTSDDTGTAWAYIDTLAERAECSRRSVQEHLGELEKSGELEIYVNAGPRGANRYKIILKNSDGEESPREGGANAAPPVQMSAAQTALGGANERRQFAPKTIRTVRELEERESTTLAADVVENVNNVRREWVDVPGWTAAEKAMASINLDCLKSIQPATWRNMRDYLLAKHPQGSGAWEVTSRLRFLEHPGDLATKANDWRRKNPIKLAVVPDVPRPGPASEEDAKALADFMKQRKPINL